MQDNFNIHDWRLKRAIDEYHQTNDPVPTPVEMAEVGALWDQLRDRVYMRADLIASAAPTANVNQKALSWNDLKPELQGLLVGYLNNHPNEYYFYQGLVQAR